MMASKFITDFEMIGCAGLFEDKTSPCACFASHFPSFAARPTFPTCYRVLPVFFLFFFFYCGWHQNRPVRLGRISSCCLGFTFPLDRFMFIHFFFSVSLPPATFPHPLPRRRIRFFPQSRPAIALVTPLRNHRITGGRRETETFWSPHGSPLCVSLSLSLSLSLSPIFLLLPLFFLSIYLFFCA